jgi:hypothetical protein
MDALQFAYWLQGFAELNGAPPSEEQWQSIRNHLQQVFKKVTPQIGGIPKFEPRDLGPAIAQRLPPTWAECSSAAGVNDGCGTRVVIC